nr:immunoglobulin light chain junction region [Macaca mulatta]MOV72764.1 immunoglobulin light chain junction region [Macaca mulatta]MOV73749.1 immunoglobulin light chain junction region [Macaca mulatta]
DYWCQSTDSSGFIF